jgi:hypothetical protein
MRSTNRESMVAFHLFDNKLFSDKIENLKISTIDKQRLLKRKETVKSMKFLRRMGEKLREE